MMKVRKKLRKARQLREEDGYRDDSYSLPTRDDSKPIDTQEQEETVEYFERSHAQQSRLWRGIFGTFLVCYMVFLIYSIVQQVLNPWGLRYHVYFIDEVDSWLIIFADLVAILVCMLAVIGLSHSSNSYKIWYSCSCYLGFFLAMFWLYHIMRLPRFRWEIMWLPVGPLSGAAICLYVDHLLLESLEDIRKLRSSMYYYKIK